MSLSACNPICFILWLPQNNPSLLQYPTPRSKQMSHDLLPCVLLLHRMASEESAQCLLLALLDPCLVAILQCCAADDQRSLFSAARAHSRLRQAAAVVLRSLTMVITDHQQADSMLLYLANHGMHVDNMSLRAVGKSFFAVPLRQLPPTLQLTSLELCNIYLQLQPGWGFQGVLGYAGVSALKRLQLEDCTVLDGGGAEGLAAALSWLPAGLEHFSIRGQLYNSSAVCLPTGVLEQLQQLTSLELSGKWMLLQGPDKAGLALQPPGDLTRLVDLRLEGVRGMAGGLRVIASMLSGACHLTRLDVSSANFEVDTLAGRTHLQHLHLPLCKACGGPAGEAQLLSYLQHLQQLTHLDLKNVLQSSEASNPPAAAYAALTASSKLRHLNITGCTLPNGVWQHMFSAAKQLPHLRCLNVSGVRQGHGSSSIGPAPEGSRLVSCCPTLESLGVEELNHGTGLLNALQGLSGLHTLSVGDGAHTATSWQLLCQLTGLRSLSVTFLHHDCLDPFIDPKGPLLQLTQLQHLTSLYYSCCFHKIRLTSEVSWAST